MDVCAELTLRIIRLVQEHDLLNRSSVGWHFFPGYRHAPWSTARDILAAAPKPLIVAALVEPGALAMWSVGEMRPSEERDSCEHAFANQCAYFDEKLRLLGLGDGDAIALRTPAGEFMMTVADFRRWMSEYALSVGLSLESSAVGAGRIIVRLPGGGRPPLGVESAAGPSRSG